MDWNSYLLFWICVFGLCLGSFYNVVILRSLSGESIVFPASKCPKCNHKLYFWHNIPVISYILLRGKCYFCKEKISIQYPIIELLTMVLFALSFIKFGLSYTTLFVIFWLSALLIVTVTDIKEKIVDCNIAIAIAVSGLIYGLLVNGWHGAFHSFLGLIAGALIMELIARSGFIFIKSRAMGEGDTYIAASLGAIFGIFSIVKVLLISIIASMIFIIPVFLYNKFKAKDYATCILSFLFAVFVFMFYTMWQNYYMLILIMLIGLMLVYFILKGIQVAENRNYLPYVPALSMSALYFIFFVMG